MIGGDPGSTTPGSGGIKVATRAAASSSPAKFEIEIKVKFEAEVNNELKAKPR